MDLIRTRLRWKLGVQFKIEPFVSIEMIFVLYIPAFLFSNNSEKKWNTDFSKYLWCYVAWDGPYDVPHGLAAKAHALLYRPSINLRSHHKLNLISLQEPLILQVFSVYGWSLKQSLGLLHVLTNYRESGYLSIGKAGFPINNDTHQPRWQEASLINVGYNQWTSRIVALTFLTKSVNNGPAFLVQKAHAHRAFLRNNTRTDFASSTTLGESTQLLLRH